MAAAIHLEHQPLRPLRVRTPTFAVPLPVQAAFLPHVSIGYINRDGEAKPIAAALRGLTARPVDVTFAKADLLECHRDHRMYEWTGDAHIPIGKSATSASVPNST